MEKELAYRDQIENAKDEFEEEELKEKKRRRVAFRRKHAKMYTPLHETQLREVWKRHGFDPDYFDIKTLFQMHDMNNDG